MHLTHEIDVHDAPELLRRCVFEPGVHRDGGDVDPGVDPAEGSHRQLGNGLNIGSIGDVTDDVRPFPARMPDLLHQRHEARFAPRRYNGPGAPVSEPERDLAPIPLDAPSTTTTRSLIGFRCSPCRVHLCDPYPCATSLSDTCVIKVSSSDVARAG